MRYRALVIVILLAIVLVGSGVSAYLLWKNELSQAHPSSAGESARAKKEDDLRQSQPFASLQARLPRGKPISPPAPLSPAAIKRWEGLDRSFYPHAQVPNGIVPDCLQGALKTPPGVSTARSHHFGGVNALMGDGSVRFVAETIAQAVWRGLGTRNGRELVD